MALVPRARHQAATVAPQRVVPVQAARTGVGQLARGLNDVSNSLDVYQDEIDTAAAKEADTKFSDEVRQLLYEDGSGFMNRLGGNAVNERDSVSKRLKERQDEILGGLSGSARKKAQGAIEGRYQGALQRIDRHSSSQRRTYLNDTANARVSSAINDAIFDPEKVQESIKIAIQEAQDAGARNGSSPEVVRGQIAEAQTKIHSGIVKRIAAQSPVEAMRYLQDNKKKMLGSEVASLTGQLAPAVKEYKGRQAGRKAFADENSDANRLRNKLMSRGLPPHIAEAFVMNFQDESGLDSGRNEESPIVPGSRGGWGLYQLTGPRRRRFESFARARGVSVSDEDTQLDFLMEELSGSEKSAGDVIMSAGTREAAAVAIVNKFLRPSEQHRARRARKYAGGKFNFKSAGKSKSRSLADIADPAERSAALREYKLLAGVQAKEADAARERAADAAFKLIEDGGNVNDLPIDFRKSLGQEEMSSLRTYQDKVASGQKVETDPEQYVLLSKIASQNPDGFVRLNPAAWRDKLDDGDFQKFVDLQRTIRTQGRKEAKKASILVDAPTISSLRTASSAALKAAGLTTKSTPKAVAAFEREIVEWADTFTRKENKTPTPLEVNEKISRMLTPVVLDPKGWTGRNREQKGAAFQIDYDGNPLDPDDDITLSDVRGATIQINGQDVEGDILDRFVGGFTEAMGRNPTAQEVIDGLVESGIFQ